MAIQHPGALDALIAAYKQQQRRTRGLREKTLYSYERHARLLIRAALGADPVDVTRLAPSDVVDFFAATSHRFSPRSMKTVRTALRSFFRFLRVEGLCDERLEASLPAIAHWRLQSWCAWRPWGSDPRKSPPCAWRTSIGARACSICVRARHVEGPLFLFHTESATRWRLTCATSAPRPQGATCSCISAAAGSASHSRAILSLQL